ncbi:MAG: hypothetical protein M1830_002021 [Pleopsidium flavum]|nr:MAG: hypothetical protein M1830_002021 [Pleopsidium flavum]
MTAYQLPTVHTIPTLSTIERAKLLDTLFEPCVPLHTLSVSLLHEKSFSSYDDLIASVGVQLTELAESSSTSDTTWLLAILSAHPRLGDKKVDSAQSVEEQAQLNTGGTEEVEDLNATNMQYEEAFGFRYVVFVDGRGREEIIEDMQSRIKRRDIQLEKAAAIKAICDIAADRARKLLS